MAKVYSADFSADAATLYEAALGSVRSLGYKGEANHAGSQLTFKTGRSWKSRGQEVSVAVAPVSGSTAKLQVSIRLRQLFDWGEGEQVAQRFIETVNSKLRQGQLQQQEALSPAIEAGDTLHDMVCPRCGSEDWKSNRTEVRKMTLPEEIALRTFGAALFLLGVFTLISGVALMIILIGFLIAPWGILFMGAGVRMMMGQVELKYCCQRCKNSWKPETVKEA